jgi:hypothetical protein
LSTQQILSDTVVLPAIPDFRHICFFPAQLLLLNAAVSSLHSCFFAPQLPLSHCCFLPPKLFLLVTIDLHSCFYLPQLIRHKCFFQSQLFLLAIAVSTSLFQPTTAVSTASPIDVSTNIVVSTRYT